MAAIALIGPDGAGKTTVTRWILGNTSIRVQYLYMGVAMESSNRLLPTSRLVKSVKEKDAKGWISSFKKGTFGQVWAIGRLVNHLAEEWYRQAISWYFQIRGFLVLYDRHFLVDFSLAHLSPGEGPWTKRFHLWHLKKFFPKPSLVIFLDAPGTVLFERKREKSPEELERRRQSYLALATEFPHWTTVDATQDLAVVKSQVRSLVEDFVRRGRRHLVHREAPRKS